MADEDTQNWQRYSDGETLTGRIVAGDDELRWYDVLKSDGTVVRIDMKDWSEV